MNFQNDQFFPPLISSYHEDLQKHAQLLINHVLAFLVDQLSFYSTHGLNHAFYELAEAVY